MNHPLLHGEAIVTAATVVIVPVGVRGRRREIFISFQGLLIESLNAKSQQTFSDFVADKTATIDDTLNFALSAHSFLNSHH